MPFTHHVSHRACWTQQGFAAQGVGTIWGAVELLMAHRGPYLAQDGAHNPVGNAQEVRFMRHLSQQAYWTDRVLGYGHRFWCC